MRKMVATGMLCACAAVLVFAAQWSKKPYPQWSREDVKQLFSNSPWGKSEMLRHAQPMRLTGTQDSMVDPTIVYTVYLRSARPIREALVRSAQFEQKYDQMDDAAKKEFDGKYAQFLDTVPDQVTFQVRYEANDERLAHELALAWQRETLETVQKSAAFIGPDGKRLAPLEFVNTSTPNAVQGSFRLTFPRPQGEVSPKATIWLEFVHPDVSGEMSRRMHFKFPLKDMQYGDTISY